MISDILAAVSNFIISIISETGYAGVFILMFLNSMNVPVPSEVIMPFSGFLVYDGAFNFWLIVFVGAVGSLTGALVSYNLAAIFVRGGFNKHNRITHFLINDRSLAFAEGWFKKYGVFGVFLGRLLPLVSTFISFPAGLAKMPLGKFSFLTFLGSLIWSFFLAFVGFSLGQNWETFHVYFRKFDYLVFGVIILGVVFWIWHRFRDGSHNVSN